MYILVRIILGCSILCSSFVFSADVNEKDHFLFIGNPGVGKSALINALVGENVFDSGLSAGTGLTTVLQTYEKEGRVYIDTPGLADLQRKEQAAQEIEKALKMGGRYRLFFVFNLNQLRLMEQDLVTLELVLDAIKYQKVEFNIIINNVARRQQRALQENTNLADLLLILGKQKYQTESVIFIPTNQELTDEDIDILPLDNRITDFIYHHSKAMNIESDKVTYVDWNKYKNLFDATSTRITNLTEKIRSNDREIIGLRNALADEIQKAKAFHVIANANAEASPLRDPPVYDGRYEAEEIQGLKEALAQAKKNHKETIEGLKQEKIYQRERSNFWDTVITIGIAVGTTVASLLL